MLKTYPFPNIIHFRKDLYRYDYYICDHERKPAGAAGTTGSARLFGFTPFSVFLPQALAGVLSVLLLYHLVRRHFGVVAGLLAALALAISPISVVTNRNNTIDSTLC